MPWSTPKPKRATVGEIAPICFSQLQFTGRFQQHVQNLQVMSKQKHPGGSMVSNNITSGGHSLKLLLCDPRW
jgi:hypothetical protein